MNNIKVYITKYALTKGIIETEDVEICHNISENRIRSKKYGCFYGNDWQTTKEGAILRAEQMKEKKIQSFERQLEKLKGLKFSL